MKNIKLLVSIILFISFTISVFGQTDLNELIPTDENVKIGKLDNGLTYYIRHNVKPKDRAEFFLVVNAGAVLEEDDQDGLAHFCEHMAFNGTKNFQKHEIINYLQSIGMKFGPEINAFTSFDVTNYMLQKVPTDIPENVDTALLVLFDWASNVLYENEEIDNERGVIHEEWRTRRSAGRRLSIDSDKKVYEGSKYAKRSVIGDLEIIDKAPYEAFTRFYNDWYRPDLQAIIAIGDFDVKEMEDKIVKQFSQIPKKENPKERTYFDIPDHKGLRVVVETDEEARGTNIRIMYKHDVVKDKTKLNYLRDGIVSWLFTEMFNNRIEEITQKSDAPFTRGYSYYGSMRKTKDAFTTMVMPKNNEAEKSLEIALTELKRLNEFGFTENEFKNAKLEVLKWYEKSFKEKDKKESGEYTWTYYGHFLDNEPIPSEEFNYEFAQKMVPGITIDEVNKLTKEWITDDNQIILVNGPKNDNIKIPNEKEITEIHEKVKSVKVTPYEDIIVDKPLIKEMPKGSSIKSETQNKDFDFTEYTLENGAKVIVKKTDFKEDELLISYSSKGGSSLYGDIEYLSASNATNIARESGLGDFNKTELTKYNTGKIINNWLYISDQYEGGMFMTRPDDFESSLEMLYTQFTNPAFTEEGYNLFIESQKSRLENKYLDPTSVFYDKVTNLIYDNNPRRQPLTVDKLKEIDFATAKKIYLERFNDASDFTFILIGNIDIEKAKPLIEKYIGGLPSSNTNENWKDDGVRRKTGIIEKVIEEEMKVAKSTVYILYHKNGIPYNLENIIKFEAIKDILDVRYTETIREEQGGTYGVSVVGYLSRIPYENLYMRINFDCDPEKANDLKAIAYEEIKKIKENGPEQSYLDNFKKNKNKERQEELIQNFFWLNGIQQLKTYDFSDMGDDYLKIIDNLTIEDIKKAANDLIDENNRMEFILKPKN